MSQVELRLKAIESKLGWNLPDDYRKHLETADNHHDTCLTVGRQTLSVDYLLTLTGLEVRLEEEYREPHSSIEIGGELGVGLFCLDATKTNSVYFRYESGREIDVAQTFDDFLSKLRPIPRIYCPIERLAEEGSTSDIQEFFDQGGSVGDLSHNQLTVIEEAIKYGNQLLFDECLSRECPTQDLLHRAVDHGRPTMVDALLANGVDVNQLDESGKTPLDYLCGQALPDEQGGDKKRHVEQLLLSAGAKKAYEFEGG